MDSRPASGCQVEEVVYQGWSAVRLTNGLVSAVAVPEIGGRIMSFELGAYQYLFLNKELAGKRFSPAEHLGDGSLLAWKNYGGDKTWPAPQGWERDDQWHGPPDPVLDTGNYTFETTQDNSTCSVTMISPPDLRTGLRIHRRATMNPKQSKLLLDLTFENVVDHPIRWSIWDVMQLDCSKQLSSTQVGPNDTCWLYIPVDTSLGNERPYHVMFGEENPQWHSEIAPGVMGVQYLGHIGKIGVASSGGWLAFANQSAGYVLCVRFTYEQGAEYPDGGASVECWTESPSAVPPIPVHSIGHLLEAEVLSPFQTLHSKQKMSCSLEWAAAYCPGPIVAVNDVACTHRPLEVIADGDWVRVSGIFGCFEPGQAQLIWLDEAGNTLDRAVVQTVSPLSVFNLNQVLPLPTNAVQLRLELIRADNTLVGVIDETPI